MVRKVLLIILLGVDLRPDAVGDGLGDSDRQVSLGIFDDVVDHLRVFQRGVFANGCELCIANIISSIICIVANRIFLQLADAVDDAGDDAVDIADVAAVDEFCNAVDVNIDGNGLL